VHDLVQAAWWEQTLHRFGLNEVSGEWALMALSVAVAVLGIVIALRAYGGTAALATSVRERFAAVHRALLNKYWVDELYDATVVRFTRWVADTWKVIDEKVVDGTVNGVGFVFEAASAVLRLFQTGFVGTYAMFFALGVLALLIYFVRQ
jgi:NADH-quinone oxidoreductase subunit L